MKKLLSIILVWLVFTAFIFSPVFAKSEKVYIEGTIDSVDSAQTITVSTEAGDEFSIFYPDGNFEATDVGEFVMVKGVEQDGGTILANWVKIVCDCEGQEGCECAEECECVGQEECDCENECECKGQEGCECDGDKWDSAYCSGWKDKSHPVLSFLADHYGKNEEDIVKLFCDGHGVGQIWLALQTELALEFKVTYDALLERRFDGEGWGVIWKSLGSQGKPKDTDHTPPGQMKEKKNGKIPPGQLKKNPDLYQDPDPDPEDENQAESNSKWNKGKKPKKKK